MESTTAAMPVQYVGFWPRVIAFLIDSLLVSLLISPIGIYLFGVHALDIQNLSMNDLILATLHPNNVFTQVAAAIGIVLFWVLRSTDPGKMVVKARIVDASTLGKPSAGQCIVRYLGYFVSTIPLGLGFFWIAFDPRKQGWHDKLAGTVVIRAPTGHAP